MPEMRQDIMTGRWVIVATERAMRPGELVETPFETGVGIPRECPFCPGNEDLTPPEIMVVRSEDGPPDSPGWELRVVPNKFAAFAPEGRGSTSGPPFPSRPALGVHEVIIHGPDHNRDLADFSVEEIARVVRAYRERYKALCGERSIAYIHIIINKGHAAGASLDHPHSQLFGMPVVPPALTEELEGFISYANSGGGCVLCDLMTAEIEAGGRVISDEDQFLTYSPYASGLPFETRIAPKSHSCSIADMDEDEVMGLARALKRMVRGFEDKVGKRPYNLFFHLAPCDGGDYRFYHWHLEMLPRITVPGGFEWGTGLMINIVRPEDAAEFLRD